MKHATLSIAIATALSAATVGYAPLVLAAPAATVLFTQDGAQIVGADGKSRPAKQGDVVQSGERLQNPPNTVTQLLLTDGSLIGMRPASEVKIDVPAGTGPNAPGTGQTISLVDGAVRVIGAELMDKQKPSALTLQTGQATVKLNAADLESAVVRPDAPKTSAPGPTGSYSRLQTGSGSIQSGAANEVLTPRQVSFVGATNAAPIQVASVSPTLFASTVIAAPNAAAGATRPASVSTVIDVPTTSISKTSAPGEPLSIKAQVAVFDGPLTTNVGSKQLTNGDVSRPTQLPTPLPTPGPQPMLPTPGPQPILPTPGPLPTLPTPVPQPTLPTPVPLPTLPTPSPLPTPKLTTFPTTTLIACSKLVIGKTTTCR